MTKSNKKFLTLIRDYLVSQGKLKSDIISSDDYILESGLRYIQVRMKEKNSMLISTPIFINNEEEKILPLPIAEFNAFHLMSGGYSVLKDPDSQSFYVEQQLSIDRFDSTTFSQHLENFSYRAVNCVRWYRDAMQSKSI